MLNKTSKTTDPLLAEHERLHIQAAVNTLLADYFADMRQRAGVVDPRYAQLWQTMGELIMAGGKRLRPYLVVQSYTAFGGANRDGILYLAAAHELLHFSLLIHDDIIDRDLTRYGRRNIAGTFLDMYKARDKAIDALQAEHAATSAALLAGDLALSAAHQFIVRGGFDVGQQSEAMQLFGRDVFDVAAGELLDSETSMQGMLQVDTLKIAQLKTASYSFVHPLIMGATLGNAPTEAILPLRQFGEALGVAYQLVDDLLGMFGLEAVIGKSVSSDIREGKATYLLQTAYQRASDAQRQTLDSCLGSNVLTDEDLVEVRHIVVATGAKASIEAHVDDLYAEALHALEHESIPPAFRAELRDLAHVAIRRVK